jgi:hypothetical protein
MKIKSSALLLLVVLGVSLLAGCGAPNSGAKDVISPADHRQHEIAKEKHETS